MFDDLLSNSLGHENLKPIVNNDFEILVVGKFSSFRLLINNCCVRGFYQVFDVIVAPAN